jgi:hypothetical protein
MSGKYYKISLTKMQHFLFIDLVLGESLANEKRQEDDPLESNMNYYHAHLVQLFMFATM